jgi:ketosteroid isomerase-like protein
MRWRSRLSAAGGQSPISLSQNLHAEGATAFVLRPTSIVTDDDDAQRFAWWSSNWKFWNKTKRGAVLVERT